MDSRRVCHRLIRVLMSGPQTTARISGHINWGQMGQGREHARPGICKSFNSPLLVGGAKASNLPNAKANCSGPNDLILLSSSSHRQRDLFAPQLHTVVGHLRLTKKGSKVV